MATVTAGYTEGSASITAPNFFYIKKILTVTGKEDGQPWIFCIGADSILRCYRRCADFTWAVTNLSSLLQLSGDEKVTAFDADQRGDFTAYFAVAVGSASKATGRIILFKPFETSRDFSMTIESLEALIIPSNNKITSPVLMIRLCKTSERSYPQIIISYKQTGQISHAQDVARILVEDDLSSWSCQTDLTLPVNATEILDICPGSVFGDLGIFILYQVGDNKRLLFSSYAATTRTSVKCPEDSVKILAVPNHDSESDLLIAADGIYRVSQDSLGYNNAEAVQLLSESSIAKITDFSVATKPGGQDSKWTVWAVTEQDSLICFEIPRGENPEPDIVSISVTSMLDICHLSCFHSKERRPCFVITTRTGRLLIFEPSVGGQVYSTSTLSLPPLTGEVVETYDCTLTITNTNTEKKLPPGSIVRIQASTPTIATVHGKSCALSRTGTFFDTNEQGVIQVTVPKSEMSLRVDRILDENGSNMLESPLIVLRLE